MGERKKDICFAALCIAAYMAILWFMVPFVYGIIDDRSMMEIVSGQYLGRPDAHTIFIGYWYSLFLAKLYSVLPNMDWYALCYLGMQAVCMWLVMYRILIRQTAIKKKILYAAFLLLIFAAFGLQAAVQLSFTTTAAVLGVTVVFWYMSAEKLELSDTVILFLLLFLTSQVRYDIFCMTLPVCAVFWIFRVAVQKKRERVQYLMPVAAILVFILAMLGNLVGYGSTEWQAYKAYDKNRTAVYDFPDYTFPAYDGAEEFYQSIGIETKSRARTLINYNYTADDQITPEFFQKYIEAYQNTFPSGQTLIGRLWQSVKDYLKGVRDNRFYIQHTLGLILYAGLIFWHLKKRDWKALGETACVGGVQGVMWIYLLYEGRIPDRVIYSMNLMLLVTGLLLWREALKENCLPGKIKRVGMTMTLFLLCFFAGNQVAEFREKNLEMSRRNQDVESLKKYCMENPDDFYFNDVTSLAFTTYNVRLWRDQPYVMNYMSLGDWMSYSPIWREKLEQEGITSVKEALYGQDNVYLVCSFDKGLEYLITLYPNVNCQEVDKISGFNIYELSED